MTLLERARTRRPITWLTLIGVILLPVLIGGVLVAALYTPPSGSARCRRRSSTPTSPSR